MLCGQAFAALSVRSAHALRLSPAASALACHTALVSGCTRSSTRASLRASGATGGRPLGRFASEVISGHLKLLAKGCGMRSWSPKRSPVLGQRLGLMWYSHQNAMIGGGSMGGTCGWSIGGAVLRRQSQQPSRQPSSSPTPGQRATSAGSVTASLIARWMAAQAQTKPQPMSVRLLAETRATWQHQLNKPLGSTRPRQPRRSHQPLRFVVSRQ